MVYISTDGSIDGSRVKRSRNPLRWLSDSFFRLSPERRAVALAAAAVACRFCPRSNPLANGAIPAAARYPHEHWAAISTDLFFMRTMTENLRAVNNRNSGAALDAQLKDKMIKEGGDLDIILGRADFGGLDGHVAEEGDWGDLESMRGTRCSTTQSAITAYFCGAAVAGNQDIVLGDQRKGSHHGVKQFADFVSCRHQQGERNGHHRRSVYRLGIGCEDNMAGYSHAFSIVAQPNGSFFWLQSFISHYSLASWMEKVDAVSGSPHGHLSLAGLLAKLKQVDRLMRISGWSAQANTDYNELFGVDKEMEALTRGKPLVASTWKLTHRLHAFYWDEACEYPLPPHQMDEEDEETSKSRIYDNEDEGTEYDECVAANLLEDLRGILGKTREDDLLGKGFD